MAGILVNTIGIYPQLVSWATSLSLSLSVYVELCLSPPTRCSQVNENVH